jgi:hypothetical protein
MKSLKIKLILATMMFIGICALGAFFCPDAGAVTYSVCDMGAVSLAAAVAIPSYDLTKLYAATQAVYGDMQAKYGKLYVIDVNVDTDESYQFLLRRPTRQHLELIEHNKNDVSKVNDIIIKNLVVAGNELNVLDDGIVFALFNQQAAKIIRQGQAFLSRA